MTLIPNSCAPYYTGPDICGTQYLLFLSIIRAIVPKYFLPQFCNRHNLNEKYDFIVVGGGSAGAVIAARLSEVPNWSVLLIEAGPEEPLNTLVPSAVVQYLGTDIDWQYSTVNEKNACLSTNGSCYWPRGKNLGGNSVHNGMMYMRGNPKDYDNWNLPGWYWEDVLPYFKRSEHNEEIVDEFHEQGGPLSVTRFPHQPDIAADILKAAEEVGFGVSDDLNGRNITGFMVAQTNSYKGMRISSASAFLRPVIHRLNLHVLLNAQVTRVVFDKKSPNRAVGVEFEKDGSRAIIYAGKEVVLSAGAIGSPHLLLLSGVGPKADLESKNVKVVKDLPGVGENIQNHVSYTMMYSTNVKNSDLFAEGIEEYKKNQTGPLSSTGLAQMTGVVTTPFGDPKNPDIQFYFRGFTAICGENTENHTIGIVPAYLHPQSRGTIKLASNDPFEHPVITQNYLSKKADLNGVIEGIKMAQQLFGASALEKYDLQLISDPIPNCPEDVEKEEYWRCAVTQNTAPENHQGGSCKMGLPWDRMAVVDPELKVYGVQGLRVADASVLPKLTSGNTGAPVMMIGEKVADYIKRDYLNAKRVYGTPNYLPVKFPSVLERDRKFYPYPPYLY